MKGTRGLSLIELVVAMALFSLVAVMGMQTLNGTIRTRDALTGRDDRDRALAITLALLRTDLDRAAPLLFFAPDQPPQSALFLDPTQTMIGLTVTASDSSGAAFQRVEWRFDRAAGALSRSAWPVTAPTALSQQSPDRVMLTGVSGVRLRTYWDGQGWVDGSGGGLFSGAAAAPDTLDEDRAFALAVDLYSDQLPTAVELTLSIEGLGELRVLEALR